MNIKPIKSYVLIEQNITETKSESGIILDLASSAKDNQTGNVLAIGPNVEYVSVGDKILLDWSKASVINIENKQCIIIDEKNIIAVL